MIIMEQEAASMSEPQNHEEKTRWKEFFRISGREGGGEWRKI